MKVVRYGIAGFGRHLEPSVDNALRVKNLTQLDDRGAGQLDVGADGQPPVGLRAAFPVQNQDAFSGECLAHRLGRAFPYPVQVGGAGKVEEGQDRHRLRETKTKRFAGAHHAQAGTCARRQRRQHSPDAGH